MINAKAEKRIGLLVLTAFIVVSFVQHLPFIRTDIQGIHAWRQSSTMWNVRNFARHDANIFNPRQSHHPGGGSNIVRLEFPVMQWCIGMAQRVFGERIELVRGILFGIGAVTLFGMFFLVHRITGSYLTGAATAILMQYAPLFYHYTINPLPDVLALCLATWYLYHIVTHRKLGTARNLQYAGACLLGATAVKLPYLMFSIVSIYFFLSDLLLRRVPLSRLIRYGALQLIWIVPALVWYAWVSRDWAPSAVLYGVFETGLFTEENERIWLYHRETLIPYMLTQPYVWLPICVGVIPLLMQAQLRWVLSLIAITALYFTLEINAISHIHDYYMLPFLPWLYLVAAFGMHTFVAVSRKFSFALLALCVASAWYTPPATAKQWSVAETYFNPDVFTYADDLRAAIPDTAKALILSDLSQSIFSYQVDKQGQSWATDSLPPEWLDDIVGNQGYRYLYSDLPNLNKHPVYAPYKDSLLLERGSIQVYRLKMPGEPSTSASAE